MDKSEIKQAVIRIIRKYLGDEYKIVLFGSWAKGNALENSDIDIGILGQEIVKWETMSKIREEVDGLSTLRSIDVVDLNSLEESYRNNIINYAQTL